MDVKSFARRVKNKLKKTIFGAAPEFSTDWFSNNVEPWSKHLGHLKDKPDVRVLEIGSYEGRATIWLLDNILTHRSARIYCIDTLEGGMDHKEEGFDMNAVAKRFFQNIRRHRRKIKFFRNTSTDAIRANPKIFRPNTFDFVYIDGSHTAWDVLEDAVLSFRTLKKGGVMTFDDYEWRRYDDPKFNPKLAIDTWLACYEGQYELIHKGYQLSVRKTA